MFYVIGTGRSGSRSIAALLSSSPGAVCLHEPEPVMVAEATQFRYRELSAAAAAEILRETRQGDRPGCQYGESNNRLSLLVPPLRQAFPSARLIWLMRDAREVVQSYFQRGLYGPEDTAERTRWQRWRLRADKVGAMSPTDWNELGPFARVCWLISYTLEVIERDTGDLGTEQLRTVRLEDLEQEVGGLTAWLDIERPEQPIPYLNRRTRRESALPGENDGNIVDAIVTSATWTAEQKAVFEHWCGPYMDRYYPDWRDRAPNVPRAGTDDAAAEVALVREQYRQLRQQYSKLRREHDRLLARRTQRLFATLESAGRRLVTITGGRNGERS